MILSFWVWLILAKKIQSGGLFRTNRHGAPVTSTPPFKFGERIILPQTYWDGGAWVMPPEPVSADDPGGPRSRLYVYLQDRGYGRSKPLFVSRHWLFPRGTGLKWRYEALRGRYGLSPDDARLVISIEDGKDYSENALKIAKHRERQMIEEILSSPAWRVSGDALGGV